MVTSPSAQHRGMTWFASAALIAAALLLVGCGVAPGPGEDPTGSGAIPIGSSPARDGGAIAEKVAGRTFETIDVQGHTLAPDSAVDISFGGGNGRGDDLLTDHVGIDAGCNSMGGTAHWDGAQLTLTNVGSTEMACEQALMDQDEWVAAMLADGVAASFDGDTLVLTGSSATIRLADRAEIYPDRPLAGTLWRADGIIDGAGDSASVSSVPAGLQVTMSIVAGQLDVFDGLTPLATPGGEPGEPITIGDGTVEVSEGLAGDAIGCAPGEDPCRVDVAVLGSDFDYRIDEDRLTVTGIGETAGQGLTFRADGPALVGHTFRVTALFTDTGSPTPVSDDAAFTITFGEDDARVESSCGEITYDAVHYEHDPWNARVDLGEPVGPECEYTTDSTDLGLPHGNLMVGYTDTADGSRLFLSLGLAGWYLQPLQ